MTEQKRLFVLSYRSNFTNTCGRSCNCVTESGDSDLEIVTRDGIDATIDYIASRLWIHDEHASFVHIVTDDPMGLMGNHVQGLCGMESSGEASIHCPKPDSSCFATEDEDQANDRRVDDLETMLRAGVATKVRRLKAEAEAAKQTVKEKAAKSAAAAAEAQDRQLYESLRAKYEAKTPG